MISEEEKNWGQNCFIKGNLGLDQTHPPPLPWKQARKPRSYASPKLRPSVSLTGVKCGATSEAKNLKEQIFTVFLGGVVSTPT